MISNYTIWNLKDYIDDHQEKKLKNIINSFNCSYNLNVDNFLKNGSINSYKMGQSATYFVFDSMSGSNVGYFTLAVKPTKVPANRITNKMRKKLCRVTSLDEDNNTYLHSSYLIAQLGKNYAIPKSGQIKGKELLKIAEDKIVELKEQVGGISCFLECEDNEFLKSFYQQNNYSYFDERYGDGTKYLQLMKLI